MRENRKAVDLRQLLRAVFGSWSCPVSSEIADSLPEIGTVSRTGYFVDLYRIPNEYRYYKMLPCIAKSPLGGIKQVL